MLRRVAVIATAAQLLSLIPAGAAYADPTECQVVLSSGRCYIAAVDPGRPGGPLNDGPAHSSSSARPRSSANRTNPAVAKAGTAAQRYTDELRARVLGQQPPAPDVVPAPMPRPQRAT